MSATHSIRARVKNYIVTNFFMGAGTSGFSDDDSFLEKGIVDSTGILELVSFIEETFAMKVKDEELSPANLDSVNKLVSFIDGKVSAGPGTAAAVNM